MLYLRPTDSGVVGFENCSRISDSKRLLVINPLDRKQCFVNASGLLGKGETCVFRSVQFAIVSYHEPSGPIFKMQTQDACAQANVAVGPCIPSVVSFIDLC